MDKDSLLKMLYHQCKALQNTIDSTSEQSCAASSNSFVRRYNKLRLAIATIDKDAGAFCSHIIRNPRLYNSRIELAYMNRVRIELTSLITYLEGQMDKNEEFIGTLINAITAKLRSTFRDKPSEEKEIQDNLDIILNVSGYKYLREKVTIPYSSKYYVPDFTFDRENMALEVKFCNRASKEKELIDEINADIQAYKTRYKFLIFIVYDMGLIRDVERFCQDISSDHETYVIVIKH